jgi:hypothetical protein
MSRETRQPTFSSIRILMVHTPLQTMLFWQVSLF